MFGNTLMISVQLAPASLEQTLSPLLSRSLPPRQTHSQFTFRRVRLFYINRQPLWQRVWLGGGPQIPLKVHSSLGGSLFEDRKSNKGGGRWLAVCRCCCFRANFCLCADGLNTDIIQQQREDLLPVMWAGTKAQCLPGRTQTCSTGSTTCLSAGFSKTTSSAWSSRCLLSASYHWRVVDLLLCASMTKSKIITSVCCCFVTIIAIILTAPWSWLQAVCRCPPQCCRPSAESVKAVEKDGKL